MHSVGSYAIGVNVVGHVYGDTVGTSEHGSNDEACVFIGGKQDVLGRIYSVGIAVQGQVSAAVYTVNTVLVRCGHSLVLGNPAFNTRSRDHVTFGQVLGNPCQVVSIWCVCIFRNDISCYGIFVTIVQIMAESEQTFLGHVGPSRFDQIQHSECIVYTVSIRVIFGEFLQHVIHFVECEVSFCEENIVVESFIPFNNHLNRYQLTFVESVPDILQPVQIDTGCIVEVLASAQVVMGKAYVLVIFSGNQIVFETYGDFFHSFYVSRNPILHLLKGYGASNSFFE